MAIATAVPDELTERSESPMKPGSGVVGDAKRLRKDPEKTVNRENGGRRGPRKRLREKVPESTPVPRYFLTKPASNGAPELDQEVEDENAAMIEALKRDRTFMIVTEWRPRVDTSVRGRPVIEKEAASRSN